MGVIVGNAFKNCGYFGFLVGIREIKDRDGDFDSCFLIMDLKTVF